MATATFCPNCGATVAGARLCPECGSSTALGVAQEEPVERSHEEQVEILRRGLAQLRTQGWKVYKSQPTPYEAALIRKSFLSREFMTVWVETDGRIMTKFIGKGGVRSFRLSSSL
jgi:hypothetical protein